MRLCRECKNTPWPYLIATFLAALLAGVTWLMLAFTGLDQLAKTLVSGAVFLAVLAVLVGYMLACMRRHCQHAHVHQS